MSKQFGFEIKQFFSLAAFSIAFSFLIPSAFAQTQCREQELINSSEGVEQNYLSEIYIPNFRRVTALVFRGGQPQLDTSALDQLYHRFGVRKIVDLIAPTTTEEIRIEAQEKNDWNRISGGQGEWILEPQLNTLVEATPLNSIYQALIEIQSSVIKGERVFVHCLGGRDRTGLMIAALRVVEGCSPKQAVDEYLNRDWQPYRPGRLQWPAGASVFNSKDPQLFPMYSKLKSFQFFIDDFQNNGPFKQAARKACVNCFKN